MSERIILFPVNYYINAVEGVDLGRNRPDPFPSGSVGPFGFPDNRSTKKADLGEGVPTRSGYPNPNPTPPYLGPCFYN